MRYGRAIVVDRLSSLELEPAQPVVYDREIGMRLLYQDPDSGGEHYLVRYPAGLEAGAHRHTAAHTIVVLEGRLAINDQIVGPGSFCHVPAGETMWHAPAEGDSCLFVIVFHGPADVHPLHE
jgi:quercetin dioxygenase-like cupin family protein